MIGANEKDTNDKIGDSLRRMDSADNEEIFLNYLLSLNLGQKSNIE